MSEIRLIDAEALKEAFEKVYPLATNEMGGVVNKQIYDIINNAPTIQTFTLADIEEQYRKGLEKGLSEWESERPEGEWEFKKFDEETGIRNSYFCSKCGYPQGQVYINFCGNCGATMRKDGVENG